MRRGLPIYLSIILGLFWNTPYLEAYLGLCCGKCGGNMPLNIPGGGIAETHEFRIKLSPSFMRMEGMREGTHRHDTREILGEFMAAPLEMEMTMVNLSLGYSLTDDLFAGLMLMYVDKAMVMKDRQGRKWEMRSQGLSDTMLMTKYRLYANDPLIPTDQVSLLLGMNLPTGSISQKDEGRRLPYGMQLGSGTLDPLLGVLYQGSSSPWWWGVNLLYTPRFYDNREGYRLGDEFRYDLYLMHQPRYDLVLEFQLNGWWGEGIDGERDEVERGVGHQLSDPQRPYMTPLWDPHSYGGNRLEMTWGVQWQPWMFHILNVQLTVPLLQDYRGLHMERDYQLMFNWYIEWPTRWSRRTTNPEILRELGF